MERKGDWMQTVNGRLFWPMDPREDEVHLDDIAHALSMMCRFNGHCTEFYSVAEHSIYVSQIMPPELALWGLLHDAAEAYVADIARPAKRFLPEYKAVETRIQQVVYRKFGLVGEEPAELKIADNAMLAREQQVLMCPAPAQWPLPEPPAPVAIRVLSPVWARAAFKDRFRELTA